MLGNDIVDLLDAETGDGSQHPRFDQRVFTQPERSALARSADRARARWAMWAVKESAYKGLRALRPETVFSPVGFAVDLDSEWQGTVTYRGRRYCATVELDDGCVHAIVFDPSDPSDTFWGSQRIECAGVEGTLCEIATKPTPSQQVRMLALDQIAARLGIDRSDLDIGRASRIPHLIYRGQRTLATLSLSHHGSYVGFACRFAPSSAATVDHWADRSRPLERATL